MPPVEVPLKRFEQQNGSIERLLYFKLNDGIVIPKPDYKAEITVLGNGHYERKVTTKTGLYEWVAVILDALVGNCREISVTEKIFCDGKDIYTCDIADVNGEGYSHYFSFKENYKAKKTANGIVSELKIVIDNRFSYPINKIIQGSYFRKRYERIREELAASVPTNLVKDTSFSNKGDPELSIYQYDEDGNVIVDSDILDAYDVNEEDIP